MKNFYVLCITIVSISLLAGCGSNETKEITPLEYCLDNGGTNQDNLCMFTDGSYCITDDYFNGKCTNGKNFYPKIDATSIAEYCVDNGGKIMKDDIPFCIFSDGSYCIAEDYFNGKCIMGEVYK